MVAEMKVFIGMLLLFIILKLPHLELYWSKRCSELKAHGISDIIPTVCFEQHF